MQDIESVIFNWESLFKLTCATKCQENFALLDSNLQF